MKPERFEEHQAHLPDVISADVSRGASRPRAGAHPTIPSAISGVQSRQLLPLRDPRNAGTERPRVVVL